MPVTSAGDKMQSSNTFHCTLTEQKAVCEGKEERTKKEIQGTW